MVISSQVQIDVKSRSMGKWSGKSCRIAIMMALTLSFFIVEIVIGHVANSLALVADSFHMLSDVLALVVGLLSVRVSNTVHFS